MLLKLSKIQKVEKIRIDDVFDIQHLAKANEFYLGEPNLLVNQVVIHNCSTHAGGTLLGENLDELLPLIKSNGKTQSPWCEGQNVRHLEPLGFIKFDILGIGTLRMFEKAISLIIKSNNFKDILKFYNENLHPDVIDFDDKKVYEHVFHQGNFVGIFQFEEEGAQRFALNAKPYSLDEITFLSAAYRPGPLSVQIDKKYIEAKNNPESITYIHPLVKEVLEKNYGFIVYQEDLAWLAHKLGKNISLEEGNLLRKVLTKKGTGKGHEVKETIYAKYIAGCFEKGISEKDAGDLWEKMEYFSQYGFNRCLSQNTMVEIKNGKKTIDKVVVGEKVNSINGFIKVKNVYKNGRKKLYKIKTISGKTLTCTLDHKLQTKVGMKPLKYIIENKLKIITKE